MNTQGLSDTAVRETASTAGRQEVRYMTALRQKAHVVRIRQCMAVASIIQRAWRRHKRKNRQ